MREAHYDKFKDPSIMLLEDAAKLPCRTFMSRGHCDFGDSCRYSHLTPQYKEQLQTEILDNKRQKDKLPAKHDLTNWLKKVNKLPSDTKTETEMKTKVNQKEVFYELPEQLANVHPLPPSLLPPHATTMTGIFDEWG